MGRGEKWGGIENEVLGRILGGSGNLQMLGFGRRRRGLRLTRSLLMMGLDRWDNKTERQYG